MGAVNENGGMDASGASEAFPVVVWSNVYDAGFLMEDAMVNGGVAEGVQIYGFASLAFVFGFEVAVIRLVNRKY